MSTKVRKQIYLEERQNRLLKREAKAQRVSEAELVRRAIDAALKTGTRGATNPAALKPFLEFARKRLAQGPIPGGRRWKREDVYEERLARYGKRLSSRR
jgi:hypothetical protein